MSEDEIVMSGTGSVFVKRMAVSSAKSCDTFKNTAAQYCLSSRDVANVDNAMGLLDYEWKLH